ncbi:MAG: tetratricopeptide repeat protein [Verrucomicrobiales bacterium]|nr:tetratricopeptide repeat protein [Verrucomicrobiales bacterium]
MSDSTFLPQFSPQWADPEKLEAILVQREDLLRDSVAKVRESILTDSKHHLLFVGSRGSGKSHLVTLIQHRLRQDAKLATKMRIAWLNEDETATNFLRLLILIYRSLSERYPDEFPEATIQNLMGKDPTTARDLLEQRLVADLKGKTAVVILENLDSLFHHLPPGEQLAWRAFLQNHPVFATVGTAQALFKEVSNRDEPFFGFFDTSHLKPLTVDEARTLLEKIATLQKRHEVLAFLKTPTGRSRVIAIRALAGGNPRLYVIFSELLTQAKDLDDLVRPFEEMVDRQLTSYYQERLRWLSPQQREIIQLLCRNRHPVPVKNIAEGLFTTHNSITGQLKQLREMGYLISRPRGREVFYELAEPMMRLAIQVKETHDRRPLSLIVDFLRIWYEREELENRLAECNAESRFTAYFGEAHRLTELEGNSLRLNYLRSEVDGIDLENCTDEQIDCLRSLAQESDDAVAWNDLGIALYCRGHSSEAVEMWSRVVGMRTAPVSEMVKALCNRGVVHSDAGRRDEAIEDYRRAIELPNVSPYYLAVVLNNRGVGHSQAGRADEAIRDYTHVIEMSGAPVDQVSKARFNRGVKYAEEGRPDEAIIDFSCVIELPDVPVRLVAQALYNRGVTRDQLDEEMADYTRVIELPDAPVELVVMALNNRGTLFQGEQNWAAAINDFQRLLSMPSAPEIEDVLNRGRLAHVGKASVTAVFAESSDPSRWSGRIASFLKGFANHNALKLLGEALVKYLPQIGASALNHSAWDAWANTWEREWQAFRSELPEEHRDDLTIPLRLLRVGIDYLKAEDEGELLALPLEERRILREALELPPEKTS